MKIDWKKIQPNNAKILSTLRWQHLRHLPIEQDWVGPENFGLGLLLNKPEPKGRAPNPGPFGLGPEPDPGLAIE
jgi:hypothetical protein